MTVPPVRGSRGRCFGARYFTSWTVGLALLLLGAAFTIARERGAAEVKGTTHQSDSDRPATIAGFVEDAPVIFEDVTERSGVNSFRHQAGSPEKQYIIETKGGGVGLFDFDGDGLLDIYFVSASPFEALLGRAEHGVSRLFRNNGDGSFSDVTEKAGVGNHGWGFGVVAGDYDGDGQMDFYVTNLGPNRLYRNNGDGTFSDLAAHAGVDLPNTLTTGATFGDYDRDGDLDLFVCGYAAFDAAKPPRPGLDLPVNFCRFRGEDVMCGPRGLPGARDFLFRNNGDGTFTEVAEEAGVADPAGHYGFSPVWVDVNDDGWVDLVVVNDSTPNYLYLNARDGTFEDVSYISGFALNADGRAQAGMGLAVGDYNLDGLLDFLVSHFSDDYNTLYENRGDSLLLDVSYERGLGDPVIPFVGWGIGFLDYDCDGYPDLFVANGHAYPLVDKHRWGTTWAQRPLLFRNLRGERFEEVPPATGSGLSVVVPGRGAAFGDLDNDGWIDVVLNCVDSSPKILRNVAAGGHNWVSLQLVGGDRIPPLGVGAVLVLEAGGIRQRRDVFTGGSFVSHSDQRVHFGVGKADTIDRLEILWPDGMRQAFTDLPVNRFLEFTPGESGWRDLGGARGWSGD